MTSRSTNSGQQGIEVAGELQKTLEAEGLVSLIGLGTDIVFLVDKNGIVTHAHYENPDFDDYNLSDFVGRTLRDCVTIESIPKIEYPSHTRLAIIPGRPPNMVDPPKGCKFAERCRYAQERCFEEEPELTPASRADHVYRCFYPVGTPEGDDALARNQAAGRLDGDGQLVQIGVSAG